MIRVLVVEDSLTVRRRLCDVLAGDAQLEVVGEAENGKQAIELCQALKPDVVTMDMMLPVMTGLAATEYIMAYCPTPILVVSSSLQRGELFRTYDALAAGAVDVLEKPDGREPDGPWEQRLVASVKMVSRIRVITRWHARPGAQPQPRAAMPMGAPPAQRPPCAVIGIGASTGGPSAIVQVLQDLPARLRVPVLLVLHINEPFGAAFAEWLDARTPRRVAYAKDGEPLAGAAGRVLMAPPDHHLRLQGNRLRITRDAERHSCRPSVDVLFESMAQHQAAAAACLLTGMGRDGAAGLLAMRQAGGFTIAQDEASCVVYGMPREAALLGAADAILPLDEIGAALAAVAGETQP
ncbi:MAG TPA: chemotaxis-specific protein-glutamate methyltransferase CheB [Burkholderiaceae bacterium]|nr:chemotaxis-specific protein-glutamate methyltransferase CheB [Burkholderiaceae bacterium]